MNTRRKFLLQGSMATTALLIADPFKSLANALSPVTGYSMNDHKIVLIHTGNSNESIQHQTIKEVNLLKRNTGNLVHIHTGGLNEANSKQMKYDVCMEPALTDAISLNDYDYSIIYKGNIKIGIVKVAAGGKEILEKINTISAHLKNEKNCQLVVCLSQLGYKNKTAVDDIQLANSSTCIDVIISGHPQNFSANTVIAQNSNKGEVIIHTSSGNGFALGNIEIGFDKKFNKNYIAINNLLTRITDNN